MIGIVVVSHSRPLAEAAVALAEQMVPSGGPEIAVAAGVEGGGFGTDAAAISLAIQRVDSNDGVLVLVDLGSALLSTELALEFLDADLADRVRISSAPLVEGLLSAVVTASTGADLDAVAAEALHALDPKRAHLDEDTDERAPLLALSRQPPEEPKKPVTLTWRTTVANPHGLHIRPAAAIVAALRDLDADVQLSNASTGRGPAPATSLSRLAALELGQGQILEARITGPDAERARSVLSDLAARDFGENLSAPKPPRPAREPTPPPTEAQPAPAASGTQIVIGPIHRRTSVPSVDGYHPRSPKDELIRFNHAVSDVEDYLDTLAALRPSSAGIFDAQAMLVTDREFAHEVVSRITEGFSAVDAVIDYLTRIARSMDALTDPYLRERGQDVRSVRRLLLLALMGRPLEEDGPGEPCIWLLDELDAATASRLDPRQCLGVITTSGGARGHGALTAEARGIPVLAGRAEAGSLRSGTVVAFDPVSHELWIAPSPDRLQELQARNRGRTEAAASALEHAHEPALTRDGHRILVEANVSSIADAQSGARFGADGSGVVRTEILFGARTQPPTAEEQAEVYVTLGRTLGGPLSIRTWDAGGDKPLAFLPIAREANPALGARGLRALREHPELLAEQLRGIALAARETPVRVLFPMVTRPDELVWARSVLAEVLAALGPVDLPVGMMVEVPAAALRAADFRPLLNFASIGTNDLAQYTLASDRTNASVAGLTSHDDPAVWDLIALTCRGLAGIPVAVCGDLASEPETTQRLIRLGVTELSVRPPMVPLVKQAVRRSSFA
nr:phosphoenolpyruvate--protein phosphotransferase [Propionibacterium sp.]